jgi:hypothetical protein
MSRVGFAAVSLVALGATGCADLLGLEQRTYEPLDGSADDGALPADAGGSDALNANDAFAREAGPVPPEDAGRDARGAPDASEALDANEAPDSTAAPDASAPDSGVSEAGVPEAGDAVIATGLTGPWLIAADESNVYWTELGSTDLSGNGAVKSCAVQGCATPFVYAANQIGPRGIAVDALNVYWDTQSATPGDGAVWSCPIAGCGNGPTKLASANTPYGLAVDATYVYWVDTIDNPTTQTTAAAIHRVPKDGSGMDVTLVSATDPNNPMQAAAQIALDPSGTALFINQWASSTSDPDVDLSASGVYRLDLTTSGEPTLFYDGQDGADWPLAVDAAYVYFAEGENAAGHVLRITKAAPATRVELVTGLTYPYGLAVSGTLVYYADEGSGTNTGTVARVTTAGQNQTVLGSLLENPGVIAVNGEYVFWADLGVYDDNIGAYTVGSGSIGRLLR